MNQSSQSGFRPRCPTCDMLVEAKSAEKFLPFCSLRCRMVDLGRWLNEEHALPCKSDDEQVLDVADSPGTSPKLPPGWHDA